MNILGLIYPSSLLQQIDQQRSLESHVLRSTCSSAYSSIGDMSRSRALQKSTQKASEVVKSQENSIYHGSCEKSSEGLDELSRHSSALNRSAGFVSNSSNVDESIRRTSKKKKKKGKMNKKYSNSDVAPGTVDLASQTCPASGSSSKERATGAELAVCDQRIAMVSYHSSKEVIETCFQYKSVVNCNSAYSQATLNSEVSKSFLNTSDVGCLSSGSKESSELVDLQEPTPGYLKFDRSSDVKLERKQNKITESVPPSRVIASVTGMEKSMCACFEKARNGETKLFIKPFSQDNPDLMESHILCSDGHHRSSRTCENSTNRIGYGGERSNATQHNVNSVAPSQSVEHEEKQHQISDDTSRMPNCFNNRKQIGKENTTHFVWQKTRGNIVGSQTYRRKTSSHDHLLMDACSLDTTLLLNRHSFSTDGLLPPPLLAAIGRDGLNRRVKDLRISGQEMYSTHGQVLVDSPDWFAQQRFHSKLGQYESRSTKDGTIGYKTREKSTEKQNRPFKYENFNHFKGGLWVSKAKVPSISSNLVQEEVLEVPSRTNVSRLISGQRSSHDNHKQSDFSETHELQCLPSCSAHSSLVQLQGQWTQTSGDQKLLHKIQPHTGSENSITEGVFETFHASLDGENKTPACFENEVPGENNIKEGIISGMSLQKWVPTGKNDSLTSNRGIDASNITKIEVHQEKHSDSVCEQDNVVGISKDLLQFNALGNGRRGKCLVEDRKDNSASDYETKNMSICICSQTALEALGAAYSLQIESESFHRATGSPIAEFERLLYSASPVIVRSFIQQNCEAFFGYQPIQKSICKFQNPNVLLRDVWSWYERPGNYGLEVKAEDSHNLNRLGTKVVSFHAHFVPTLSAVQLFGRSHHSLVGSSPTNLRTEVPEKGEAEEHVLLSSHRNVSCPILVQPNRCEVEETTVSSLNNSVKTCTRSFNLSTSDGNDTSKVTSALSFSNNSEVIFEYFEHEPPQQRKPLYAKVKELMKLGTANPQVFGDPSKLECMSIQDLHPASWYSVAWYPIYRIPEGNFRASFLTYHSLGHLVLRRIKSDLDGNAFCVVSPAVGMQSYNAQGECWFYPRKSADNELFSSSKILKERLRTLEETAALFARGHVYKGHTEATNRHPDYEFFLSRRR